jgi:FixJ family two-component response regulator
MTVSTVHVVDDDGETLKATARLLATAGFEARTYSSAHDFLNVVTAGTSGCIILDMRLPDRNGLDLQAELIARGVPLPIVFLTGYGEIPDSVQAIQRGAVDFLIKPIKSEVLLAAVFRALEREAATRASRAHHEALQRRFLRLTPREREVLAHLISGKLNKQVAGDLQIAERTVKLHRANILEKLEVGSMAELARLAVELEIEPAGPAP